MTFTMATAWATWVCSHVVEAIIITVGRQAAWRASTTVPFTPPEAILLILWPSMSSRSSAAPTRK